MPQALILNAAQARAVYDAMCALNNVGAKIGASVPNEKGRLDWVAEKSFGSIVVERGFWGQSGGGEQKEIYANQAAFAAAYGLQPSDEAKSSYSGMFGTSGNMPGPEF